MYDFQQIYFLQSKRLFKLTKEFFHDVFKPFFIIFEKLTCQEGLIGVIVDFIFFLPQKWLCKKTRFKKVENNLFCMTQCEKNFFNVL